MGEYPRLSPCERSFGRADGAVFVGVMRLHQNRADPVGAEVTRQIASREPLAFEIATDLRARCVDRQPPPETQFTQAGPAALPSSSISSAVQHIMHSPQDFPGAAANVSPRFVRRRFALGAGAPLAPPAAKRESRICYIRIR